MAINPALLIAAPMLQDLLVDKATGLPLAAGVITLYEDSSRTTLKNWYYQSGSVAPYTFLPLNNPMTLSAVGTIVDPSGNDVIPFYYPYSETDNLTAQPYYITVYNSQGTLQFTRENFPYVPGNLSSNPSLNNLIINNVFWKNITAGNTVFPAANTAVTYTTLPSNISINGNTYYYANIAPSQHDGFIMPDINFFRNSNDGTDTILFGNFVQSYTDQILVGDATPEYFLQVKCTSTGTDTLKYIQIPISLHVDTMSGLDVTVSIQAQNVSGQPNNTFNIGIFQFLGTGVTSPATFIEQSFTTSSTWTKYSIQFKMPSAQGVTLGGGGDDAYYLQIGLPAGQLFGINLAVPAVYVGNSAPTANLVTYDVVDAVINSPRVGDVRQSLNLYYPFGWVPMNNGTIGNASSNADCRANSDTWLLFNLLWEAFSPFSNGTTNLLAQMVDSTGTNVAYGVSAIADFNANKAITVTSPMGRVIMGGAPVASLLPKYKTTFTASNSGGNLLITTSNTVNFYNGMPIYFTNTGGALPDSITTGVIYYVSGFNLTNTFFVSTTFINSLDSIVIAYGTTSGSGTNTVISSLSGTFTGEYQHTQLLAELAAHTHTAPLYSLSPGANELFSNYNTGGAQSKTGTTDSTGSSTPFNVTQPSTYMNFYIKL